MLSEQRTARHAEFMSALREPNITHLLPHLPATPLTIQDGKVVADFHDRDTVFDALFLVCMELKQHSSSQSYGARLEKVLLFLFEMKRVAATDEAGDGHHPILGRVEVKVSISDKGEFSFQQIRSGHADHYLLVLCDIPTQKLELIFVPAKVMTEVVADIGKASHGGKATNLGKSLDELEMGLRFNNSDFLDHGPNHRDKHRSNLIKLLSYSV